MEETIVAIASAAGIGARGIVRISGPQTLSIVRVLLDQDVADGTDFLDRSEAMVVYDGNVHLREQNATLPASIYLWPNDRSYTRQPMAEIHTLCSGPLMDAVLHAASMAGARLAHPGEFTLRAFLAGRIDLLEAEAVLGTIDADNERELHVALRQLAGGMSVPLAELRDQLLNLLADLEAGLDFVEEDISFVTADDLDRRLARANEAIAALADQLDSRHMATSFPRVVLGGAPNAGKSSLFNALAGRNAAVVHHLAGTTRDYVSCICKADETTIELIDTAGVSLMPDSDVDRAAQEQSHAITEAADLLLWCRDSSRLDEDAQYSANLDPIRTIIVLTKSDLMSAPCSNEPGTIACSAVTMEGIQRLRSEIHGRITATRQSDIVLSTAARCRESLREARDSLTCATTLAQQQAGDEVIATELRGALNHLGRVVGAVYTDDILDRIFSRFCIGK